MSAIKSHFASAKEKLDLAIEAYSNLPEKKPERVTFIGGNPKPVDSNLEVVMKLAEKLQLISKHANKIVDEQFMWEEFFGGESAPNKTFFIACLNVRKVSRNLASSLSERRMFIDKIRPQFDELSDDISRLVIRHKKFHTKLKSFSDARWLDRYGLPFLIPLVVWLFLISVGVFNFNA